MSQHPPIVLERVAVLVGIGYLVLAIGSRLLSSMGVFLPLGQAYWSLPGALIGCAAYAGWTGLRDRGQSALGMVLAGMAGVLAIGVFITRLPATIRPFSPSGGPGWSFFGAAVYGVLCDLSAIVFLFALFLAAYVSGRPAGIPVPREEPPDGARSA